MRLLPVLAGLLGVFAISACNPFYSVEQSTVERGYRWIDRGKPEQAISTFEIALRDYPNSGLAHLGMADALAEARRYRDAVATYTKALPLLKTDGHIPSERIVGSEQTIGKRAFSYQNQGLRVPHGIEAYLYFRRARSYEALARNDHSQSTSHLAAATADYRRAQVLAPDWKEPGLWVSCLAEPRTVDCPG